VSQNILHISNISKHISLTCYSKPISKQQPNLTTLSPNFIALTLVVLHYFIHFLAYSFFK